VPALWFFTSQKLGNTIMSKNINLLVDHQTIKKFLEFKEVRSEEAQMPSLNPPTEVFCKYNSRKFQIVQAAEFSKNATRNDLVQF